MIDVDVTAQSPDMRLATPAAVVALDAALSVADARALLDSSAATVEAIFNRPPWRQAYVERTLAPGGHRLMLSRWPIEDDPPVVTIIDNGTVDVTTYSVTGTHRHSLYRRHGWARAGRADPLTGDFRSPTQTLWYSVPFTAGWLMPGQVSTWAASTAYKAEVATTSADDPATGVPYLVGSWVRSTDPRIVLRFECTTAGTTDATEPAAFATASAADTITDGTATWTARAARELPADLSEASLELALLIDQRRTRDQSVQERRAPGAAVIYSESEIPGSILATVERYR